MPSTPRQPIEVHVPGAPKMGNKTSSALALEQAPSAALQVQHQAAWHEIVIVEGSASCCGALFGCLSIF